MDSGMDEESEGVELVTFQSGASRYLVYAPMNPVLLAWTSALMSFTPPPQLPRAAASVPRCFKPPTANCLRTLLVV